MTESKIHIYGKHTLKEAIMSFPSAIVEIYLSSSSDMSELKSLASKNHIRVNTFSGSKLPGGIDPEASHQGAIGVLNSSRIMKSYDSFVKTLSVTNDTSLILLDEIQDPQNVGAVIRSAAAFGVSAVLIPEHNQAPLTGSAIKVSAGMAFKIPLVSIGNVNYAVRDLKDRGFFVYGLSGEGKHTVNKEAFDLPSLFILGNESTGIREKTLELCDKPLSIPTSPVCESLNAATAASVALFAWSSKHLKALSTKSIIHT